jgi:hypothetical protein
MEGVQNDLTKSQEAVLPLRLAVQSGDDTDAWYLLTRRSSLRPRRSAP